MQSRPPIQHVLVVEPAYERESPRIEDLLSTLGIPAKTARTASQALLTLREFPADIIFLDGDAPALSPSHLLPQIRRIAPRVPVIVTTSESPSNDSSLDWTRGVWEALQKPLQLADLEFALNRAAVARNLRRQSDELQSQLIERCAPPPLAGSSPGMIQLLESLEAAASSHRPTLLEGELGTNKESIARALHDLSAHRAGPFIALRCRRGDQRAAQTATGDEHALTFPNPRRDPSILAAGGTLFLANIESLSLTDQAVAFRLLQEKESPAGQPRIPSAAVRVVVSTQIDLKEAVRSGTFLKELYEALGRNHLYVPALRNRQEDIPLLADHWCRAFAGQLGKALLGVNDQAMSLLVHHSWPGNLRELEAVMRLGVSRAESDRITMADLPQSLFHPMEPDLTCPARNLGLKDIRHRAEAEAIRHALSATDGNRTHAAKLLKISHRTLLYKIKAYGIQD